MLTDLRVTSEPASEPVTIPMAQAHCRIDHASDNDLLSGMITAARIMAEGYLSRALVTQTLLWTLRPQGRSRPELSRLRGPLELPRAPVQSISSVVVTDERGNATTVPAATLPLAPGAPWSGYIADLALTPARLTIGGDTPLTGGDTMRHTCPQHVQIAMLAGYGGAAAVPKTIVQAILLIVAFLYENRGDAGGELPKAAEWLLDRDRLQFLAG